MKVKKLQALTFSICLFDELINGRGGGGASIRNNIFVGKWMGFKPGGALKWDFTVLQNYCVENALAPCTCENNKAW